MAEGGARWSALRTLRPASAGVRGARQAPAGASAPAAATEALIPSPPPEHRPSRVFIENVRPAVDGGRFATKRIVGDCVEVRARIAVDGHDRLAAAALFRAEGEPGWEAAPMCQLQNDDWAGFFMVSRLGRFEFTVEAWIDTFGSWLAAFKRRLEAGEDITAEAPEGAAQMVAAASSAPPEEARLLRESAARLPGTTPREMFGLAERCRPLVEQYQERRSLTRFPATLVVEADRERARHGAWYELFPRSAGQAGQHGSFADVEAWLPYVAGMGFDVLYFPPIHPIGRTHRKGKNNAAIAAAGDPGSPWAIGAAEGGHTAVHPLLGTLDDFRRLAERAAEHGLELALDLAFQCSPDHPWVSEHPEWFGRRADGSLRYAENPPKKYEDVIPFDFDCTEWRALWAGLLDVVLFWVGQGVRIFRVDNPHTKPMPFWEWLIRSVRQLEPNVLFLAEAFTRPVLMHRLAKAGFSQSYTYFAWRNTSAEIRDYFTELTTGPARDYLRPSLWPNTPDILTEYLQVGGRPAFIARFVLAATLGANYGVYGPAFELCEDRARTPRSEEYLNSEKYEVRVWDLDDPGSLRDVVARVNGIRRAHPALRQDANLVFHQTTNDQLVCYSKHTPARDDVVLVVVNLDPQAPQSGYVEVDWQRVGIDCSTHCEAHDLLGGRRFSWQRPHHYVELDPAVSPAIIVTPLPRSRSERDFEYYA